jgi:hypothetical protein
VSAGSGPRADANRPVLGAGQPHRERRLSSTAAGSNCSAPCGRASVYLGTLGGPERSGPLRHPFGSCRRARSRAASLRPEYSHYWMTPWTQRPAASPALRFCAGRCGQEWVAWMRPMNPCFARNAAQAAIRLSGRSAWNGGQIRLVRFHSAQPAPRKHLASTPQRHQKRRSWASNAVSITPTGAPCE